LEKLEDKFVGWYPLVVPKSEPEQIKARLQAVSELSEKLALADVPKLVRQFYRLPVDPAYVQTLRKALAKDENYVPSNDSAELAVIAGAVIYSRLSESSQVADAVAFGVVCVEACGTRNAARIDDVVAGCREYLAQEAVRVRDDNGSVPALPTEVFSAGIKGLQTHYAAGTCCNMMRCKRNSASLTSLRI